ncbi:trk system potassium uptake protein TrkH [Rhodobacter aestuarii]|uniref:Trk system potassium uptake protein TrkH n=1 Tax=Rhodobacter aestuarii TaxID=453582 RepID=A0A1N7JBC3_9RHOB|nr:MULTISPECIES: potassium transporter TrkG [Rhodobacter]PTV96980.1 trk system potassium uptake protein TrkH [Rhodobacter aestuarii]SIS46561.1 trk system potassium uptake protein TrkH [Rhodobacter aestuarii]SOB98221.1 trk system potassium uptake protein TrkH [Rhodobacter sp. JA431]
MLRLFTQLPLFVQLMLLASVSMLVPAGYGVIEHQSRVARVFFQSSLLFTMISLVVGLAAAANPKQNRERSLLLTLFFAFLGLPLMLAVPFAEAIQNTGLLNAWWEMVSSFSTTGATLYAPERLPVSLHLWRALVGWMGGFFILVMAIAVLAPLRIGGFEIFFAGGFGQQSGVAPSFIRDGVAEPSERIAHYIRVLGPAYAALTVVLWGALILAGDPAELALIHAFSTLSTSGITSLNHTGDAPSGLLGEALIFLFLIPALSRRLWPGGGELRATEKLRDDPELLLAVALIVLVTLFLFARHWIAALDIESSKQALPAILRSLWGSLFTALSFLTTTGFESSSWNDARSWSGLGTPGVILAGLTITGGGIATTAGGVRLLRVYALFRLGQRELEKLVHPQSVAGGGQVARRLRREGAYIAWIFFMLFALSIAGVMLAVTAYDNEFEPALVLSIAALSNTGQLASVAVDQPIDWALLGAEPKVMLALAMVLGRLETLAIIALFNPDFWRN